MYVSFVIVIALIDLLISLDVNRTKIHLFLGFLIISSFYIIAVIKDNLQITTTLVYLVIAMVTFFFSLATVAQSHQLQISHFSLMMEKEKRKLEVLTEVLEQYIPICSHCKSIRDEKGKWVRIEEFIRQETTSKIKFTHGLCDHCLKEYYPDE